MPAKKKTTVKPFVFPLVMPEFELGDKMFRLSPIKTVEESYVFSIERYNTGMTRGALLSHRYGVVEICSTNQIKSAYEWMTEKMWKDLQASSLWEQQFGMVGGGRRRNA